MKSGKFLLTWLPLYGVLLLAIPWCAGVLAYTFHAPGWGVATACGAMLGLWIVSFQRKRLLLVLFGAELMLFVPFFLLTPQQAFAHAVWQPSWSRVASAVVTRDQVRFSNVRDFNYRSENNFDVRYIDFAVDPATVKSVDIAVSHWDGLQGIAHTMLSFGFEDGRYLAVSMETRLPEGVRQGFVGGIFKQYEILMILATEEDLFKLRTDFRKEELYLYRTNATKQQAHDLFDYIVRRVDSLDKEPEFYNSVTRNCTTSLAPLLRVIDPSFEGDIRLLFNGYSDELLFELGYLKHMENESFAELKARRLVNRYLEQPYSKSYSEQIRSNL